MPKSGSFIAWGAYLADPVQTVPASFVQWQYLQALRAQTDFKENYPYPRTPEKEAEFQALEKRRKFWNTMADYTSIASGFRNLLVAFQFAKQGEPHLAAASLTQAVSSFGWVLVQQTPKWLKINPTTKAAIRWSSIGLGMAVPSLVVISKLLEESNDEQKGPSIADLTWNGLEAVAQHVVKPFYRFGYAPTPTGAGPAVWSPGTGQFAGIPDAGTNGTLQPGYGFDFSWRSFDDPIFRQDGVLRPLAGQGRVNPELERQGYDSVVATADETIGSIARAHKLDVAKTILLNMDHIPNPVLIFPGDQIYLPASCLLSVASTKRRPAAWIGPG